MLLHLLLDEMNGLFGDITTVVIKALELSQEWEQGVSNSAAKLVIVADIFGLFMEVLEEGNFWHFSLEVGPIFEEIALMELIKLIPYFLASIEHLFVLLLGYHGLILGQL